MTQRAAPGTVLADFTVGSVRAFGDSIALRRDGDRFYATMIHPRWKGPESGEPEREEFEIVLVTGMHNIQIYWAKTGLSRVLAQVPVAWDVHDESWFPTNANFLTPPHPEDAILPTGFGTWNHGCIQCHVTDGRPQWGGPPFTATEASEFGISCEACHGPGEAHASHYQDPGVRYADHLDASETAHEIVNPTKLPHDRGSLVCGRCHSVWSFASNEHFSAFMKTGVSFTPGDDFASAGLRLRKGFREDPESFWSDDLVRPSGREYSAMLDSPCYRAGELTCFSCHTLHASGSEAALESWRDDQLKPGMRGNAACLQCHDEFGTEDALRAHSHHEPQSSGSECQNCHTPYTSQGLRKAIRSHTITNPSAAVDQQTGRPNACSGCHLDQPIAWAAKHLESWYGQPQPVFDAIDRAVPAAVVDALRGDAGQRALAAWALSWPPAVEASGAAEWAIPVLSPLLIDPYSAVRSIAGRSLRWHEGIEGVDYDWVAPAKEREAASALASQRWAQARSRAGLPPTLEHLLLVEDGIGPDVLRRLYEARDDRPVRIAE